MKKPAMIMELRVPLEVAPFMDRHATAAARTINTYLNRCPSAQEKLGALGVLAQVLIATGDSIQAMELARVGGKPN